MGNSLVRGCRGAADDDEDCEDWQQEEEELVVPEPLTEEDKIRLRQTWKALESDPAAVGIIMFTRLFEAYPDMKEAFPAFRDVEFSELKKSHELRHHSSRVMGFVNKVITRLDSEDQCATLAKELCCRHVTYGALPCQMTALGQQFIFVIRESLLKEGLWNIETQLSWEKLFQWISCAQAQAISDMRMNDASSPPAKMARQQQSATGKPRDNVITRAM